MSAISTNEAPRFKITVAGQEVIQQKTQGVTYMSIEDHLAMISVAQLTFNSEGLSWKSFAVGKDVEVQVDGKGRKIFAGVITGLRHSWQGGNQSITILGMGPMVKMAASRVTKVYEKQKDSDIASAVIGRAGLQCGTVDSTGEKHDYVLQRNESDFNFMNRLASRNGYLVFENEGKVDFKKPQFSGSSVEISKDKIVGLDYSMNPMNVPPELTVIGWDYITKEIVTGTASSGDVFKIGGGKDVVGENGGIWQKPSYISDVLVASQTGAKEMAVGEINRLARGFVRGRAVVKGNGALYAGVKVKFSGLPPGFNPEALVVSSRHSIDVTKGFITEVNFVSNTHPA